MMYRRSKIATRLLYKVRHHKGHGVHSPFVFNLINNVIEEKCPYYCYGEISTYLSQFSEKGLEIKKDNLLSFRLVNYFNAKNILEIGSGSGVNTLYLSSSAKDIKCLCIEEDENNIAIAKKIYAKYESNISFSNDLSAVASNQFDCIYINLNNSPNLQPADIEKIVRMCHEKSFIIVKGIRKNKKQNHLWKCLTSNKERTAELDLFNIGLLFFDKQLYRWRYQISF